MFQGGFVDYLLVFSAVFMIRWTDKQAKLGNIKSRRKYMCAGFFGAAVHLISIQPLFYGIATAYSPLAYITTLFILPTFVLYTYWASSGSSKVYKPSKIHQNCNFALNFPPFFVCKLWCLYVPFVCQCGYIQINLVSPNEMDSSDDEEISDKKMIKRYSEREMQRVADSETDQDDEKGALVDNGGRARNDIENGSGDNSKPVTYKDVGADIIARGVSNIDPSVRKTRNWIFVAAFFVSLINSIIVYMAPCYLDLSYLIDCD